MTRRSSRISGRISEDPAQKSPAGTSLKVRHRHFGPGTLKGAGTLEDWAAFDGTMLTIGFKDQWEHRVDGSAVMVGPGVALAAAHVFSQHLDALVSGETEVLLSALTKGRLTLWRVNQITVTECDIVILTLALASRFPPKKELWCAAMSTRTPAIGEKIMIAGFRSASSSMSNEIDVETRVGIGDVTAIYPRGRDRVMAPFPCLEVRCLTLGGMSGGPAFDQNGRVIGVLASSFEHDEGPSYVSLTWPVLGSRIESVWLRNSVPTPTSLLELAARKLIALEGPESLKILPDERIEYEPWS